jgi:hypothetical protein
MSRAAEKPVPAALAMIGALSFASLAVLAGWQVMLLAIGWLTGPWTTELDGLLRASVLAAVAATLLMTVVWRSVLRSASRSLAAALSMVSVGLTGSYWLLPGSFLNAV